MRTGLGAKAIAAGLPDYLRPFAIANDLRSAARDIVGGFS
jgi:hypothetical protein